MEVNNPPPAGITVEHDCTTGEALSVPEMERDQHNVASNGLDAKILGH
jgi:hypothetical protein